MYIYINTYRVPFFISAETKHRFVAVHSQFGLNITKTSIHNYFVLAFAYQFGFFFDVFFYFVFSFMFIQYFIYRGFSFFLS